MIFARYMLAADVFATIFIGLTLWRLANRNGHSMALKLIALVFFSFTVTAVGWLTVQDYGAETQLMLKPGWWRVAAFLAGQRSAAIWALALHMVWIATRKAEG